ncbi:maleylpyruvate isomerase family mycothiol-dependent enzyme [Lentzea sp. NBC_00516]|uniref:maleylpyruvate isomerase family mycothiol-dependent enzyme n=1 Tax=Lentzea sp. NBC_00516 TaxID=2903582 RepID=UPI002E7FCF06|nr:maleylpyruvate isomerase family mycothiol-dependent enzyme [Lentzea sp. NBC_00516]WUD24802.1 maleylpyruvate isomerase family mycothiol-dependent enzyme [Lentzea sp. NBC_00516]
MTYTPSTQHTSVPAPRGVPDRHITAVREATDVLYEVVEELDEAAVRGQSLLPGWTRGHVITHLARNADALVNLLTWAKTGVEHQAYASRADRDADIEEGSRRLFQVIKADLDSACQRFEAACREFPAHAWRSEVTAPKGQTIPASAVPLFRLREIWIHLIDLDAGVGFDDLPADFVEEFLDDAVRQFEGRVDSFAVEVTLPDGSQRSWTVNGPASRNSVSGSASAVLGWLTGRTDGTDLRGELPELPDWI